VQAGFAVEVLALEAQVLLGKGGGLFFVDGAAPDLLGDAPGHFALISVSSSGAPLRSLWK